MFDNIERLILANHKKGRQAQAVFILINFIFLVLLFQTHVDVLKVKVVRLDAELFLHIQFYLKALLFDFVEFLFEINLLIHIVVLVILVNLFFQFLPQVGHLGYLGCIGFQVT